MKQMNKVLSLVLAILLIVSAMPLTVSAVAAGDLFYDSGSGLYFRIQDTTNKYVAVYPSCNEADDNVYTGTNYVIPEKVTYENAEYTVIEILDYTFQYSPNLETVSIPDTVYSIGGCAFFSCYSLTSVNIPDSVTYIGYAAFNACKNVESFTVPESVTYIGSEAFCYCLNANITVLYDEAKELGITPFGYTSHDQPYSVVHKLVTPDSVTCDLLFGSFWNCSVSNIGLATHYYVSFHANGHKVGEYVVEQNAGGTLTSFDAADTLAKLGAGKYTVYARASCEGYASSDLREGTTFTYGSDSTAPTVSNIEPERTATNWASLKFTSSEKGTFIWNYADKTLDTNASGQVVFAGENSVSLSLDSVQAQDIQFVVKDYMGNVSAVQTATVPKMVHSHSGTVTMTYDTEWSGEKAFTNICENMNIVLTDDVKFTNTLQISNSVTVNICLNGYTLNMQNFQLIAMSGNVHICDCSAGKTGKIIGDGNYPTVANTGATLTLDGISVTNEGGTAVVNNTGILNVANSSVITTKDKDADGIYAQAGTVNVTDSEIISYGKYGVLNSNNSTFIAKNSTITGGIDTEDIVAYGVFNDGGTVTLENTSVIAEGEAVIAINNTSEGTFTLKDSTVTHNGGGKYTILHYGGNLSIDGGEIHSKSQPITVSQGAQVYLYNDTEITTTFSADIYLRGMAAITAHKKDDATIVYTGEPLVLTYENSYAADGSTVVYGSTDTATFSVENTKYQLLADSGNLVLNFIKETVTIAGVEAATGLIYNGQPQAGYTGTPTNAEGYTGEYTVTYAGRNGTVYSGTTAPAAVGEYTVTLSVPADNADYTGSVSLNFAIGSATFTAAVAQDGNLIYNGQAQVAAVKTTESGVQGGQSVTYKYGTAENACNSDTVPAFTDADTYTVYFVATAANHGEVKGSFDVIIDKKELTVTANDKTIVYGDAPSHNGVTYSGFIGTDDANALQGTLVFEHTYAQYGAVGNGYTITPKGLLSSNYTFKYVSGILTVNPAEIGLDWSTQSSFAYSGAANLPTAQATGALNGDIVNVRVAVTSGRDNVNVGTFTAYAAGLDNANYKLPDDVTSPVYAIIPKNVAPIIEVADAGSYDGAQKQPAVTVKDGDTVVPASEYTVEYTDNIFAGTATVIVADKAGGNYTVAGSASFVIKKATPTVTWPENLSANIGETLSDITLPSGFAWDEPTAVLGYGDTLCGVTYTPADTDNYNTVSQKVTVKGLDTTAPIIAGIESGKEYYGDTTFKVDEKYLDTVTVDGETVNPINGQYTIFADNKEHTVIATDKAGNQTKYTLTVYFESITVSVPIEKTVIKGGTKAPDAQTFAFALLDREGNPIDDAVLAKMTIANTIETSGAGTVNGYLTVTTDVQTYGYYLSDGFLVREIQGDADGWTYSDALYYVIWRDGEAEIYRAGKGAETGEYGMGEELLEKASFTNTYTKDVPIDNTPDVTPSEPSVSSPDTPESPKTGEDNNMALWLALLFISGVGIAAIPILAERKRRING